MISLEKLWECPMENDFPEGLLVLIESINRDASLNRVLEIEVEQRIRRFLRNRWEILQFLHENNEISSEQIIAPVFIVGLGRTGSTFLSYLLNEDKKNRSMLAWEAMNSVPRSEGGSFGRDFRIREIQCEYDEFDRRYPRSKLGHYEDAETPVECVYLFAQDFKSIMFEGLPNLRIPTYGEWLQNCDFTSSYEFHMNVLRVLQKQRRGRWMLKSPQHSLSLSLLKSFYPDAFLINTHRDPVAAYHSAINQAMLTSGDNAVHQEYLRKRFLSLIVNMVDKILQFREQDQTSVVDLNYLEFLQDPIGSVKKIYGELGEQLDEDTEKRIITYCRNNPRYKYGHYSYSIKDSGIPSDILDLFSCYRDRFGVPKECH